MIMNLWNRIKSWFSEKESTASGDEAVDKPYEYYYKKISKYNGIMIPGSDSAGNKLGELQFWLREDGIVTIGPRNHAVLRIEEAPKAFRIYYAYSVGDVDRLEKPSFVTIFK